MLIAKWLHVYSNLRFTRTKLFCTLASFNVSSKMFQSIFAITSHFEQYQGGVVYVSLTLKDETQIW